LNISFSANLIDYGSKNNPPFYQLFGLIIVDIFNIAKKSISVKSKTPLKNESGGVFVFIPMLTLPQ